MKNFTLEGNKYTSYKEKSNKKDFSSNFKYNLSKKYSKNSETQIKPEKNKIPKSTTRTALKKDKEISNNQIKSYLTNNNIHIKNKNTQKNRNILKSNIDNNNLPNTNRKNEINHKSKNISTKNSSPNNYPNPQSPCLEHEPNKKIEKKYCSKNHLINVQSPQLNDLVRNKNRRTRNNNNFLKSNLGLLITNNHNNEGDSMFKDNESYFENNKIHHSNERKMYNNKSDLIEKDFSSEDFLTKINKKNENSSLLNSIVNINRYLTNDVNNKSTSRLNRETNNKCKSKKIYENQLIKIPISKNISFDKNITNMSKSDFFQDNNMNKNNELPLNKNKINEYYCTIKTSNGTKKLKKKRNSFNLDNNFNKNNIYFANIIGYNTPRITINDDLIKEFNFSPNNYNINRSLVNVGSDFKNYSKKRIKVSKTKLYQNKKDQYSLNKNSNISELKLREGSTKSNTNKNNNASTERKNLMQINEYKIVSEFDLNNEKNISIKDNRGNIFNQELYEKDTQLNKYNFFSCEKHNCNNNTNFKKRKKNY